ncbi:fluoride efflux transporter CrcB [Aureimonas sp. ME7]|uniref:fluoride efflux transporter CrcB n=1 Tax=Aureimonas sp. ME7 TaxID=2744252 RepID=UPI0015F78156|nr:fluoride efflux transporter CrcB [Aureimonas sp. ME7]
MLNLALVALGGALGSTARYAVGLGATRWFGLAVPYGTMFVNITGSAMMGFLVALFARKIDASPELRVFLMVGILGGYTTFSSFTLDAMALWTKGAEVSSVLYTLLSVSGGLLAFFLGASLARQIV